MYISFLASVPNGKVRRTFMLLNSTLQGVHTELLLKRQLIKSYAHAAVDDYETDECEFLYVLVCLPTALPFISHRIL
jgi:hypothetical protein